MRVGLCGFLLLLPLARGQSVDELIRRALANNREYLAGAQRVLEAEALLRRAGVRPGPTLEMEGGSTALLGAPGSQDYSIAYFQPFETGGKRDKRLQAARLAVALAKAEADENKRRLTLEVRQRYIEALNARRRLAVLAEVGRVNEETLRLIAARVDEGDAAPLEKRLLETDLNRAEVDRVRAEAKFETAVLELKRLGALDDTRPLLDSEPAMPATTGSREELVRRALELRTDLRVLRLAEEEARSGVALAQADSAPNLSASARYSYRSATFDQFGFDSRGTLTPVRDRENLLAFGISVPLFTGRKNQGNVEAAVAREHEARLVREHLAEAIPREVDAALRKWRAARRAVDIFDRTIVHGAELNVTIVRQAWQIGHLRFIDVLNEQRRVVDLRLARVEAETDLETAWADLEHTVGGDIQ